MADIYIDVDTAVTVPVNVFPLTDDTDFKSREVSVAYNAAGMDLVWNFVTSAGVQTQTAVTPTTAGVYDWTHVGDGMYKIEIPASAGGSINNDTEGYGWFSGVATGVLPWRGPVIGFRASGINDALCDSAWSATRGLAGTALPAAAADAAGGLPISDAGGLDLDAVGTDTAATQALAAGATGFAAIDTVVDAVKVKTDFLPSATAGATGGVFIAGTNAATTVTTSFTTTFTGNLTGSVASVSGAVGSVTGAVGSVTGSVGSVTGAVGSVTGAVGSVTATVSANLAEILGTAVTETTSGNLATNFLTWYDNADALTMSVIDDIGEIPTNAELNARTLVAASYFDFSTDTVTLADGAHGGASAAITLADYSDFTGAASSSPQLLQSTTIATLASQVSFTLTAGSDHDDAYNDAMAVITDAATSTQKAVGWVSDYTGSTKTVTLTADPLAGFTMAATDSIDIIAVPKQLDATVSSVAAGAGSGARTITPTIDDGTTALENARIRFTEGANTYSQLTDASGNATFNLDDATYTVAITKAGYTYAGTTLVVSGNATPTYSMTAITITPATSPQCTVTFTLLDSANAARASIVATFEQTEIHSGSGSWAKQETFTATSDANGLVTATCYQGAKYKITVDNESSYWTIDEDTTHELPNNLV